MILHKLFFSLLLLLYTMHSFGQWEKLKVPADLFDPANITSVFSLNSRIYFSTYGGVFYTDDNGKTWTFSPIKTLNEHWFSNASVFANSIAVSNGSNIYTSNDSGEKWVKLPTPFRPRGITYSIDDTLYAITFTGNMSHGDSIYKYNPSKGWQRQPENIPSYNYSLFQIDNDLYYIHEGKLFKNTKGTSKTEISLKGLPANYNNHFSLAGNDTKLYMLSGDSLYTLNDDIEWQRKFIFHTNLNYRNSIHFMNDTLYMVSDKIYFSKDKGQNFETLNTPEGKNPKLYFANGQLILVNSSGIYFKNPNGTWVIKSTGLPAYYSSAFWSLYQNGLTIFSEKSSLYHSPDHGENWYFNNYSDQISTSKPFKTFRSKSKIYINSDSVALFRSDDGGKNFIKITDVPHYLHYTSETYLGDTLFTSGFRSTDFGTTWEKNSFFQTYRNVAAIKNMMGAFSGSSPVISNDLGSSWSMNGSGIPNNYTPTSIAATKNNFFVLGTRLLLPPDDPAQDDPAKISLLFKSPDIISGWSLVNAPDSVKEIYSVENYLIVIKNNRSLLVSKDEGETWEDITYNLPDGALITNLEFDDEYLYAQTSNLGIFKLKSVVINGITSTNDDLSDVLQVFPNPVSDLINFSAERPGILTISDMNNNIVKTSVVEVGETKINLNLLKPGIYILKLNSNGTISHAKFIKVN